MKYFALLAWLFGGLAADALAVDNPLRIALVTENTSVQPGQPFYVGLQLEHPEGCHTYWKFTGIVGVPTAFKWCLPTGWTADEIQWPAPERVMMFDYKAQGFHGAVLLPIRITPPANLVPNQIVTLEGQARWMCCGRACFPGFKTLKISLPVAEAPTPLDPHLHSVFAASLASVAQQSPDWTVLAERQGEQILLRIRPATERAAGQLAQIQEVTFFTEDGLIDANKPSAQSQDGAEIVLRQTVSEFAPVPQPKSVTGILETAAGWLPGGAPKSIRIDVPLD